MPGPALQPRCFRASPRAIHTRTPEGSMVLDTVDDAYFELNATGEVLWTAVQRGASADDLVRALCDAFDVDAERARADVDRWIADMSSTRLIEPV